MDDRDDESDDAMMMMMAQKMAKRRKIRRTDEFCFKIQNLKKFERTRSKRSLTDHQPHGGFLTFRQHNLCHLCLLKGSVSKGSIGRPSRVALLGCSITCSYVVTGWESGATTIEILSTAKHRAFYLITFWIPVSYTHLTLPTKA